MSAFAPAPRRSVRRPVRPGASHFALDFWAAPAAPALVPASPVRRGPLSADESFNLAAASQLAEGRARLSLVAPAAPAPVLPSELGALSAADGVFRVEVLVPGPLGVGFPVRESVVGSAPSARVARTDAAGPDSRPVAVWALVGSDEVLVWGSAA